MLNDLLSELRGADFADHGHAGLVARVASFGAEALDRILFDRVERTHCGFHLGQEVVSAIRDPAAVPRLVEILTSDPSGPQWANYRDYDSHAKAALTAIGAPAVRALGRRQPWENGTDAVYEILASVGGDEAVDTLTHWFRAEPSISASSNLVWALAKLGAVEPLREALDHPTVELREAAVGLLASTNDPEKLELLVRALDDRAPAVRLSAASALLEHGDDTVVAALEATRDDDDARVRRAVRNALGRISRGKRGR